MSFVTTGPKGHPDQIFERVHNLTLLSHSICNLADSHTKVSGSMSEEDIAEEIRTSFPGTEEIIVQYLAGYLVDDAGEEEDVLQIAQEILKSVAGDRDDVLEKLMTRLGDILEDQLNARLKNKSKPKLQKLDKVMDMSKSHLSNTIALSEGVDLESINKGK